MNRSVMLMLTETNVSEKGIAPLSLVCGNKGLQRCKRGTVSERNERPRLHGSHRAYEAVDNDILSGFLRFPCEKLGDRPRSSPGLR